MTTEDWTSLLRCEQSRMLDAIWNSCRCCQNWPSYQRNIMFDFGLPSCSWLNNPACRSLYCLQIRSNVCFPHVSPLFDQLTRFKFTSGPWSDDDFCCRWSSQAHWRSHLVSCICDPNFSAQRWALSAKVTSRCVWNGVGARSSWRTCCETCGQSWPTREWIVVQARWRWLGGCLMNTQRTFVPSCRCLLVMFSFVAK